MNETMIKEQIENLIYEVRGKQVMLDSDVARIYNSETKIINQVVKRNTERFPEEFGFRLTQNEYMVLRSQIVTSKESNCERGGNRYLPYVFTEYGIIMLSGLLKSSIAIEVNIKVIAAFINMRKYISTNLLEQKYINNQVFKNTEDIKLLQESFDKFKETKKTNEIYFNGQIYDAYSKIQEIFNEAKKDIIVIDAYTDYTILDIIKRLNVSVTIITKENNLLTKQDIEKYNKQYNNFSVTYDNTFHDRYFILDKNIVYHRGASINRIGYKTFSVTLISDNDICKMLLKKIKR